MCSDVCGMFVMMYVYVQWCMWYMCSDVCGMFVMMYVYVQGGSAGSSV